MEFFITYDASWEAKIDKVLNALDETRYKAVFQKRKYGDVIDGIAIVLMCRNTNLKFKQRIRYSRIQKTIYMDLMLNLDQFILIEQKERTRIVADKLIKEVPVIIAKYKLKDFDLSKFKVDLNKCFGKLIKA